LTLIDKNIVELVKPYPKFSIVRNIPEMGPELLGDAEWITLFSEGTAPLVENPGITMKVWTQDLYNKVVLEAFDQLGRERPADANGDIGAYELFSQKGNLNRDTVVDLEDAIIGL